MSIRPPSDIVLDVARNADADLAASATRRLDAIAALDMVDDQTFGSTLEAMSAKQPEGGGSQARTLGAASRPQAVSSGAGRDNEVGAATRSIGSERLC